MFKKKKDKEKIAVRKGLHGVQFVTFGDLPNMYNTIVLENEKNKSKLVELESAINKLKKENKELIKKNEQISNISLNIGTTVEDVAKQIHDNILKDKENKTLVDDLKAINRDLKECSFVQSNDRAKYWMIKLESLYPHVTFMLFRYEEQHCQIVDGRVG